MAVDDERDAEQAVERGVIRPAGDERGDRERDEGRGEQALEGPVVRPVRAVRRWERRRVVQAATENR